MDLNYVGKFALSEATRDAGFKVVLTGEGSDEHFAGYVPFGEEYLREPDLAWPYGVLSTNDNLRKELLAEKEVASGRFLSSFGAKYLTSGAESSRKQINNINTAAMFLAFRPLATAFSPWVQSIYGRLDPRNTATNNLDGKVKELAQKKWHPLHSSLYLWTRAGLANNLLSCLGDRVEMGHSVEARTPFLDHPFTEYVNSLPPSVKVKCEKIEEVNGSKDDGNNGDSVAESTASYGLTEKWILREATKPFITDEIYRRRKHPYSAPFAYPTDGPMHKLLRKTVTKENIDRLGLLSWEAIELCLSQAFPKDSKETPSNPAFRTVLMSAQLVILGQKFGVKRADPEIRL